MKRLLWVGDSPEIPSGFGRATREILERVRFHYDVTVLGINHRGDPPSVSYPVYTAAAGGDAFGVKRLLWMCDVVKPDIIVLQNDGWWVPLYINALRKQKVNYEYEAPEHAALPVVGSIAIDGLNFNGGWIEDLTKTVFWTQFAYDEARKGCFAGEAEIIPLGVDLDTFFPQERNACLERQKLGALKDLFIVGNVNRNQPRKRWDLTLRYFSKWVHSRDVPDARLFLHSAPTGDESINVVDLAHYYGIGQRLILSTPEKFYGPVDSDICDLYNCFDVLMTTTQGEGMGLPTMEAMACSVPCIVPEWAALGDWAKGAAAMVPCTSTCVQSFSKSVNVIGGVADEKAFIDALDLLYRDKQHRELIGSLGLARVSEPRFRWDDIGERWIKLLDSVFVPPTPLVTGEVWQDLKA
jgi:glycosyltransferase involved in cell wall biosynthesis